MHAVALLAVILGPTVGALGVFFGWLQARGERTHSLALARAQQVHAREITERTLEHERELRRADRLFEKRGSVYVEMFGWLDLQLTRIERTKPSITIGEPLPAPDSWPEAKLQQVQAETAVYGSPDVWDFVVKFTRAISAFFLAASRLDMEEKRPSGDIIEAWQKVDEKRAEVRRLYDDARQQIQREIGSS